MVMDKCWMNGASFAMDIPFTLCRRVLGNFNFGYS